MHYDKARKKWVAQARDGMGIKRTGRFDLKSDLEEWIRNMKVERQRVRKGMKAKAVDEILLEDAVRLFLQHRAADPDVMPTTFSPEPARMRWWLEQLGNRMVWTYDNPGEVMNALDRLAREGSGIAYGAGLARKADHGASPATCNRYRALLYTFFRHAMLHRWTQINPVEAIEERTEVQVRPSGHWKDAKHLETYLRAAFAESPLWGAFFNFIAFTGARVGEGQGLQWGDVEWEGQQIAIQRIVERGSNKIVPRTKGIRAKNRLGLKEDMKPLFAIVRAALLAWRSKTVFRAAGDFVFADQETGAHLNYERVRKAHERILAAARVPRITIHGLRHTFQRLAEKAGFARGETQHLLGHATITTTERYAGRDVRHLAERAEALGFGALPAPAKAEPDEGIK